MSSAQGSDFESEKDNDDSNYFWKESNLYDFVEFISVDKDSNGEQGSFIGVRYMATNEQFADILRSEHGMGEDTLACQIVLIKDIQSHMDTIRSLDGLPDVSSAAYELWKAVFSKQKLFYNNDLSSLGAEGP